MVLAKPLQKADKPGVNPQNVRTGSTALPLELKSRAFYRIGKYSGGMMLKLSRAVIQDEQRVLCGRLRLIRIENRISTDRLPGI